MSAPSGGGGGGGNGGLIAGGLALLFVAWLFWPTNRTQIVEFRGLTTPAASSTYAGPAVAALSTRHGVAQVEHRVTRAWAPCVAGYDQDPASGNCTRTVWRPGPMPMD